MAFCAATSATSFKFRGNNPLNSDWRATRRDHRTQCGMVLAGRLKRPALSSECLAAVYRGRAFRSSFTRVFAVLGDSLPVFWLGLAGCWSSSASHAAALPGWVMASAMAGRSCCRWADAARQCEAAARLSLSSVMHYLILPTLVSAVGIVAVWSRFMRASMLETINSDYMRTGAGQGLDRIGSIWFKPRACATPSCRSCRVFSVLVFVSLAWRLHHHRAHLHLAWRRAGHL